MNLYTENIGSRSGHIYQRLPKGGSSHGGQQIHDYNEDLHLGHVDAEREAERITVRTTDVRQGGLEESRSFQDLKKPIVHW